MELNRRKRQIFLSLIILCVSFLPSCIKKQVGLEGVDVVDLGWKLNAWSAILSPVDPDQLLVTALRSGKSTTQVFILNLNSRSKNLLLEVPARSLGIGALFPSIEGIGWSPDGKDVSIMISTEPAIMKPGLILWHIEKKASEYFIWNEWVSWSPTGGLFAFFTELPPSLHVINFNTKRKRIIYSEKSNTGELYSAGFSWSPDAENIVFSVGNSSKRELHIVNIMTRQVDKIPLPGNNTDPVWSPKGELIAFRHGEQSDDVIRYSYHLTNIMGKCDVEIPYSEYAVSFSWSPDGERGAFVSHGDIYLVDFQAVFKGDIYKTLCQ